MKETVRNVDDLYHSIFLTRRLRFHPNELGSSWDEIGIQRLRNELEGRCTREGYIRPGSLQFVQRSIGSLNEDQFTGDVHVTFVCSAFVCMPGPGMRIRAKVIQAHKLGILAVFGPLEILLPRDLHVAREIFETVKIGDWMECYILKKRFRLNDQKIFVFGLWVEDKKAIESAIRGSRIIMDENTNISSKNTQVNTPEGINAFINQNSIINSTQRDENENEKDENEKDEDENEEDTEDDVNLEKEIEVESDVEENDDDDDDDDDFDEDDDDDDDFNEDIE